MATPTIERTTTGRSLVDPDFFARLSRRIATVNDLDADLAEQIADQTLAYLAAAAQKVPGTGTLSPSPTVDKGVHAFLEYTQPYDDFFASRGWPKVHHHPFDEAGRTYEGPATVIPRTLQAITAAGYAVLPHLWHATRIDCSSDSDGKGGNPLPCGDHG